MGLASEFEPAVGMFSGGFSNIFSYAWLLIPLVIIVTGFMGVWLWKKIKLKESQWTHKLKVRRVLDNNLLSDPIYHRMRRFPVIKNAEVFELEKPLLGGYLLPELDEYSGFNEYSIILDKNNRIYTNKGEFFNPDKSSVNVSAKHSEIDIERSNLRSKYQNINAVSKRIEWATIAKYAFLIVAIIAVTILAIVGIQNWSESKQFEAEQSKSEAMAMESLAKAMKTMEETKNTDVLIIKALKELYDTNNLQTIIREAKNES